ncbi:MAG: dolichol kinase [Haloglomus sp.]
MANEILRRLVHASGAVVPGLWLVGLLTWAQIRYLLVGGVALAVVLEFLRLVVGIEWVVYETLTREYEQDRPAGYALYVFSGSLTGLAFGPRIAVPAMLMLTLADPIAGLVSADELRPVKQGRALAVMFAISATLAAVFVPVGAAVMGGLAAMLADGAKPVVRGHVVDDNLTIPIVAACAMFVGVTYLPAVGL